MSHHFDTPLGSTGYRSLGSKRCDVDLFRREHRAGRGDRIRDPGFCRLAPDLFRAIRRHAVCVETLFTSNTSLLRKHLNRQNFLAGRNITVIVLEVPSQ